MDANLGSRGLMVISLAAEEESGIQLSGAELNPNVTEKWENHMSRLLAN